MTGLALLQVNEIFGPTIQGEGQSAGTPCHFLRLAGCNLACRWCDTPYTWDWSRFRRADESHPRPVEDVVDELQAMGVHSGVRRLVVSGGEPMLQQRALAHVVVALRGGGWEVEVETAGTVAPDWSLAPSLATVSQWNVSPKLAHSGNEGRRRINPEALAALASTGRAAWKFVVQQPSDFAEVDEVVIAHRLRQRGQRVYIMPEGQTREQIGEHFTEAVVAEAIQRGYSISPRLHVAIWGTRRGV